MTVAELIEELQRQPVQHVPVYFRCAVYDEDEDTTYTKRLLVDTVRFDGGSVVMEED